MQTLNISETEVRSESRIKSLFWPSITNGADVDYLGAQGYWVCTIIAVLSAALLGFTGQPIMAVVAGLYFYLGGVGVRERSRYAAAVLVGAYLLNVAMSPGVLTIIICALLISNLRATWIASGWKPGSEEADMPQRFNETWSDKFVDQFPMWLWPKIRIAYYILTVGFLAMIVLGLVRIILLRARGY